MRAYETLRLLFVLACPIFLASGARAESNSNGIKSKNLPLFRQHPSTSSEKEEYRDALKNIENENYNEAIVGMEKFARNNPESDLADNAIYWMAQLYIQQGQNELARAELERLLDLYPKSDRAKRARAGLMSLPEAPFEVPPIKTPTQSAENPPIQGEKNP